MNKIAFADKDRHFKAIEAVARSNNGVLEQIVNKLVSLVEGKKRDIKFEAYAKNAIAEARKWYDDHNKFEDKVVAMGNMIDCIKRIAINLALLKNIKNVQKRGEHTINLHPLQYRVSPSRFRPAYLRTLGLGIGLGGAIGGYAGYKLGQHKGKKLRKLADEIKQQKQHHIPIYAAPAVAAAGISGGIGLGMLGRKRVVSSFIAGKDHQRYVDAVNTKFTTSHKVKQMSNDQILSQIPKGKNVKIYRSINDLTPSKGFVYNVKRGVLQGGLSGGAGTIRTSKNSHIIYAPPNAKKEVVQHEIGHIKNPNTRLAINNFLPQSGKSRFKEEIDAWKLGLSRKERIAARKNLIRPALYTHKIGIRYKSKLLPYRIAGGGLMTAGIGAGVYLMHRRHQQKSLHKAFDTIVITDMYKSGFFCPYCSATLVLKNPMDDAIYCKCGKNFNIITKYILHPKNKHMGMDIDDSDMGKAEIPLKLLNRIRGKASRIWHWRRNKLEEQKQEEPVSKLAWGSIIGVADDIVPMVGRKLMNRKPKQQKQPKDYNAQEFEGVSNHRRRKSR